jgi:GNAT superfamily N-acetyltransferase
VHAAAGIRIERVQRASDDVVRELADVLLDAVQSGAGVSFMSDLTREGAESWWRSVLAGATPRTVILAARDDKGVAGTVQLQPAWPPNQPHRADVAKLMVHRRARGGGVARALMLELERQAREQKFRLLLLDTCKGSAAEKLYASMGWQRVGEVPRFAYNPDGSMCDTVFYYKEL